MEPHNKTIMYINQKKETRTGFVMRTLIQPGTRNESDAYILEMNRGEVRIGLRNNRAYETEVFETYINEEVRVTGSMHQGVFLVDDIVRTNE